MERRKVLAAISAAIATPARAWHSDPVVEASRGLDPDAWFDATKNAGLTENQIMARDFLVSRVEESLERLTTESLGHAQILDLWILCESLLTYEAAHTRKFAGLLNAIEDVLGSDRRFVAVPEEIHEEVAAFIEERKAALAAAEA